MISVFRNCKNRKELNVNAIAEIDKKDTENLVKYLIEILETHKEQGSVLSTIQNPQELGIKLIKIISVYIKNSKKYRKEWIKSFDPVTGQRI